MGRRYSEEQVLTIYKELGIDPGAFPPYHSAEEFGRSINPLNNLREQKLTLTDRSLLTKSSQAEKLLVNAELE